VKWRPYAPLSTFWESLLTVCSLGFPLLLWWGLSLSGKVDPLFLPPPQKVWARAIQLFTQDTLFQDIAASLGRVGAGFLLTVLLGVPLGILVGAFRGVAALVEPISGLIRYLPASAFVPLLILWLGLGEEPKVGLIFLGTFFYTLLLIADAVRAVPIEWVRVSYTSLGCSPPFWMPLVST
jgi:NitT/TauT family transport system permease protein